MPSAFRFSYLSGACPREEAVAAAVDRPWHASD
jgi:hypothetical protein